MLRASSYNIYVPLPDNEREVLIVHGYTGAYDRVSRTVGDYVRSLDVAPAAPPLHGEWTSDRAGHTGPLVAIAPSRDTVATLTRRGYLTTKTPEEETGYFARVVKRTHAVNAMRAPSYIFMPTYDCNLRCSYCFQDHMRTDPTFRPLLRVMMPDVIDRIVGAMPLIEEAHGLKASAARLRSIGFFGGEPLLARNRPVVEHIIKAVRRMGPAQFWAVSNATELEAYADLLGPDNIAQVQITIDGPPDEHDKRRVYADGSGSFTRIARNIDLCLDRGASVGLRMNIDRANISLLPALAEAIVSHGWHERPGFTTYTAPITNSERTITLNEIKAKYFTSWELDEAIDVLREDHPVMRVIGRPDDGLTGRISRMFTNRSQVPEVKTSFCGAHSTMYIFDAFADMYACWERTGDASVRIGHVTEDGSVEMNSPMTKLWRSRTPASNPTCRQCRYAMHCGGGCAVLAEGRNGKLHSNHCDDFGVRFRSAVATAYTAYANGAAVAVQDRVCDL